MRVLLIADLKDWILGEIGRQLSSILADKLDVALLYSHDPGFHSSFQIHQKNYDVIHFLSPSDFLDFINDTNLPVVVTLWHVADWTLFDAHVDRIDALCVGSQQWRARVRDHIPSSLPVFKMLYGLDVTRFKRDPHARTRFLDQAKLPPETLVFGFAGSAWSNEMNRKGLDNLWSCFEKLKKEFNGAFILRIIGRAWPLEMIPLELRHFTHLSPFVPSSALPEFYSSLDYYVCTSREEGVPYPVLESMSCESVVITTRVGVVPEIIEHGKNGFFLSWDQFENDFVNFVRATSSDYDFRRTCGRDARKTIASLFSWHSIQAAYFQEVYDTAIRYFSARPLTQRMQWALKARRRKVTNQYYHYRTKLRLRSRLISVIRHLADRT
jgi:glycosyltransferase involved in cell wall biosynthesis